jgi:ubiquitin C-terminal hydrolase
MENLQILIFIVLCLAPQQQQEDAPEFLNWLLDGLHEEFIALVIELGGNPSEVFAVKKTQPIVTDEGWEEVGKKNQVSTIHRVLTNESPISSIFRSHIRNTIRQRSKNSSHIQPYHCIPLDIANNDVYTLEDALKGFLSRGSIQQTSASTQMSIDSLPPVLTIQLTRFTVVQGRCHKISKFLSYPLSLQIRKAYLAPNFYQTFPSNTGEEIRYSLVAGL